MELKSIAVAFVNPDRRPRRTRRRPHMANEAVMVTDGDTGYCSTRCTRRAAQYLLVPEAMREALFAGEEPFDGVDAIFVVTSTETISLLKTCSDC